MENKFQKTIDDLTAKVFPKLKEVLVVYLYGSVARGDFSLRHSDLDLFVILKKKKVTGEIKERLNDKIIPRGYEYGVKIHSEYQGTEIKREDRTLIQKMIEEGKIIYSSGVFTFDFKQIGLRQFVIYSYSVGKGNTMFSKVLHGRKSWYYQKDKKIVKTYKGLIDGEGVVSLGKGFLMVVKEREKDLKRIFEQFKIKYQLQRIVYG